MVDQMAADLVDPKALQKVLLWAVLMADWKADLSGPQLAGHWVGSKGDWLEETSVALMGEMLVA